MLKKVIYAFLVVTWCVIIFVLSSMSSFDSGNKSKEILKDGAVYTCVIAQKVGLIDEMPSPERIDEFATKWNTPFRKISHAFVFFVLATILMFAFRKTTKMSLWKAAVFSAGLCFLYSLTDEYHQSFVGRGALFTDCLIDTAGAFLAVIIYLLAKLIDTKLNKGRT